MIKTKEKSSNGIRQVTKTFSFTVIADNAERALLRAEDSVKMIVRYMQAATSDYQVEVYYKLVSSDKTTTDFVTKGSFLEACTFVYEITTITNKDFNREQD